MVCQILTKQKKKKVWKTKEEKEGKEFVNGKTQWKRKKVRSH